MKSPANRLGSRGAAALLFALASQGPAQAAKPADMILHNGKVLTVDKTFSVKSAVAVKDGRIIAVGGPEIVRNYRATTVIDLKGRTLMPGFTDTHMHVFGQSPRQIDLSAAHSIAEIQSLIRAKAAALGPGEWVTGTEWNEDLLVERRRPLRADIDAAAPNNPVVLARTGGHSSVGNSLALKQAGIDRSTPDPEGGVIERDAAGEPNGVIRERRDIYGRLVPAATEAQLRPGYVAQLKALPAKGITSVILAGASLDFNSVPAAILSPSFAELRSIYDAEPVGLPRAAVEIFYPGRAALIADGRKTGFGDDRLRLSAIGEGPAVDGGFSGPTAWTLQDYKGQPGFRGKATITLAALQELADTSAELGWQVGLHAIGDAGISATVEAYDRALSKHPGDNRRWFVAHFTMMPPTAIMDMMVKDGVIAAQQPNFTYSLETRYTENLDGERLSHINPVATPLARGVTMAFGSDTLPVDPRVGLYAAVTRKGRSGAVYGPEEAVSRAQAIRLYTAAGPYLTWEEGRKGTLEVGRFADMVVLDRDPLTVPAPDLLTLKVELTIIDGKIAYRREGGRRP